MSLVSGARVGPYEILSPLGAGGMGEVYKARDPRLNRLIAIKVLPGASATDEERRERFEREALAIAALNHPHIVTIYSVEHADGLFFLTMELVEGRSLAEALSKDGLPLDRLLKITIPVADAVAAAHQKGITHRDLKPANIMLGEGEHEGRVKVLDFGLAKLAEAPLAATGVTALPTAPITGEGRILGTVAYMSPEQAEGKPIDARSDLFSLGVILYEMATGLRPFTGATSISILSSIIKDTPTSVTKLNPALPRDLGRIVRRALTKDLTRRYQTAGDLRNDLEELKASLDSGELLTQATDSGPMPLARRAHVWSWVALSITAVSIATVVWLLLRRPEPTAATASIDTLQIAQLTTSGNVSRPAISPDGKYVAYVQQDERGDSLWIRQTTTASNVQIVPPEPNVGLWGATVTPDAGYIDFVRRSGNDAFELWRIPFLGGVPKRLITNVSSPVGWSPDGQHVAFVRTETGRGSTAVVVADPDGSRERTMAERQRLDRTLSSLGSAARPSIEPAWSPDGRLIAVAASVGASQPGAEGGPEVVLVDVASGAERVIPLPGRDTPESLAWLDVDSLVVNRAADERGGTRQLWRLSVTTGRLSRLTNDLLRYVGVSVTADRATLATVRSDTRVGVWVGDGGARSGADVVPSAPFGAATTAATVAWAAERLLYTNATSGRLSIMAVAPGQGTPEEIASAGTRPAATSDGRTIVFNSTEGGDRAGLWKLDANGHQAVHLVDGNVPTARVTPDDRQVIFLSSRSGNQSPWVVSIDGGAPRQIVNQFAGTGTLDVSPDGRSLLFLSFDEQNRRVIVVCDLPACVPRNVPTPPISSAAVTLRWMPDGRGFASVDPATQSNLRVQPLDGKPPYLLTHFVEGRIITDFAWSHDGKHLAIARATTTNDIVLFKGLKR